MLYACSEEKEEEEPLEDSGIYEGNEMQVDNEEKKTRMKKSKNGYGRHDGFRSG